MVLGAAPEQYRSYLKIEVSRHDVLPALCLRCGEPGTRARALGAPGAAGSARALSRTGYYCERCDEEDRSWSTRAFAWRMALGIVLAAVSASVVFWLGDGSLVFQVILVMLLGASATGLLEFSLSRSRPRRGYFLATSDHADGSLWLPDSDGARALARAFEPEKAKRAERSPSSWSISMLGPLALALGLLALAHTTLDATLIVLDREGDSALLVDDRLRAQVLSISSESPSRLTSLRVFTGFRRITWIGSDGSVRLDETVAIEPGQFVLLAATPPGLCLFLESQSYGAAGADHFLTPLGPGPVYHLEPPPEHWLSPIPPPESTTSRGGRMTALRLLPCSGASTSDSRTSPTRRGRLAESGG